MAVFTQVTDKDVRHMLEAFAIGKLQSLEGIAEGVQNSNYRLTTDKGTYVLTLFEDKAIVPELPFFFDWMEHLAEHDIPCAAPVHAKDGSVLQKLKGRPAAVLTFLSGRWPRTIKNIHCAEVGGYLAQMHLLAESFKGKRVSDAKKELVRLYKKLQQDAVPIDKLQRGLVKEIAASSQQIQENWPSKLPSGVVHSDLFPDNVLFEGDNVTGIIDFYMSRNESFVYDLANTMNAWCFEHGTEFNITKARQLLQHYQKERPLSKAELKALPLLAAASALKWFITRSQAWFSPSGKALVKPKDPIEQLHKLRFHLQVGDVREYGIS